MLLSKFFRRRKSVVERIEAWTDPPSLPLAFVGRCRECGCDGSHNGYCSQSAMRTGVLHPVNVPRMVDTIRTLERFRNELKRP